MLKLSQSIAEHVTRVKGHKMKYLNRNNSAADCSILLKFGTEFHHVTGDTLEMFKVKVQRSRSQRKVGLRHQQ